MNAPKPMPPKSKLLPGITAADFPNKPKKPQAKQRFVPKPHLTSRVQDSLSVDTVIYLLTLGI